MMNKKEFLEKYGDVKVAFSSYYKFKFTYKGELENGDVIYVEVGGDSDDIYREEVTADCLEKISSLDLSSGYVYTNDEMIDYFDDY